MYENNTDILHVLHRNTSVHNFAVRIPSVKTEPKCLWKLKKNYKINLHV